MEHLPKFAAVNFQDAPYFKKICLYNFSGIACQPQFYEDKLLETDEKFAKSGKFLPAKLSTFKVLIRGLIKGLGTN